MGVALRGGIRAAWARGGARSGGRRAEDDQGLVKPKAFVVVREGVEASPELAAALREFVKDRLAPFKYPRWIEFAADLPKTATGKIQRFRLRQ